MDFTSVEFYTIAFFVAMALLGFFLKQKRVTPASTHISAMELERGEEAKTVADAPADSVSLTSCDNGNVLIERSGLVLVDGETVNLVITVIDDKVTIVEKKGKASALGGHEYYFTGSAKISCLPRDNKVYIRYESSVTGQWCKSSFVNKTGRRQKWELKY